MTTAEGTLWSEVGRGRAGEPEQGVVRGGVAQASQEKEGLPDQRRQEEGEGSDAQHHKVGLWGGNQS